MRIPFRFAIVALVATMPSVGGTQSVPVNRIRSNPSAFINEVVKVDGKVARHVDEGRTSFPFYLEDNYGVQIKVIGSTPQPPVESRWQVTGAVAVDAAGDPYLVERARTELSTAGSAEVTLPVDGDHDGVPDTVDRCPDTVTGRKVDAAGCDVGGNIPLYLGLAIGGLVLLGGLGWLLTARRRREAERAIAEEDRTRRGEAAQRQDAAAPAASDAKNTAPSAAAGSGNAADDYFDGATMRFHRPVDTDGTIKLLPGRLEVTAGADKGQEIRLVRVGGGTPEITFGRSDGPRHRHIQLRAPTVSRRHALLRFENGVWVIANFSDTNPVILNGGPMTTIGTQMPLKDGDVFELGEVAFRFHER